MQLTVLESTINGVRAGYNCPCGCMPAVDYAQGSGVAREGCCCGNEFAVGPHASHTLSPRVGFRAETQTFDAPWGQPLEAAWLVGPSVHEPSDTSDHDHSNHDHDEDQAAIALDPVCGMTVDRAAATAKGLRSSNQGDEWFFCGKGCRLEFEEDPARYLDPSYVPSM